jgi:hypothetical protein
MTLTQDYRLDLSKCRFMIADGCAVNAAAVEKLTAIMPTGIFVVCVSHASNLVGSVFEDSCKLASSFLKSWSQMLTKSHISVILFQKCAGTSTVKTENHVRWYSWWEVANQIANNFQACEDVLNDEGDFCIALRGTMKKILMKFYVPLRLEFALIKDVGRQLTSLCYFQEGDNFLCVTTYDEWHEVLRFLKNADHLHEESNICLPTLFSVVNELITDAD